MSALPDDPSHLNAGCTRAAYLAELLEETDITRIGGTAVGMLRSDDWWLISLHDDRTVAARNVSWPSAISLPTIRCRSIRPAGVRARPLGAAPAIGLDPDAPVVLIGAAA